MISDTWNVYQSVQRGNGLLKFMLLISMHFISLFMNFYDCIWLFDAFQLKNHPFTWKAIREYILFLAWHFGLQLYLATRIMTISIAGNSRSCNCWSFRSCESTRKASDWLPKDEDCGCWSWKVCYLYFIMNQANLCILA